MKISRFVLSGFVALVCLALAEPGHAQWANDGASLSTASDHQRIPYVVADGQGGLIAVWYDQRNGDRDLYAQRLDRDGNPLWTYNGVPVVVQPNNQTATAAVPDGNGGIFIVWDDERVAPQNSDIYAQRLDANGNPLWALNGVGVSTLPTNADLPRMVSDGASGVIITWEETGVGGEDIIGQRLDANGSEQWVAGGVLLVNAPDIQRFINMDSDDAGGAVFVWEDLRGPNIDVYAQRINSLGLPQWTNNGVAVSTEVNNQTNPVVIHDGTGGALIAWRDARLGFGQEDIYAQRVNATGSHMWTLNGEPVCTAPGVQSSPRIVTDGAGGIIIGWNDERSLNQDVYARRVDQSGAPRWMLDGIPLTSGNANELLRVFVSDGEGGAVAVWEDDRNGLDEDVYAQRVDFDGNRLWSFSGVPVATASGDQIPRAAAPDDFGGTVIAFNDMRNSAFDDMFAQRVENRHGTWGRPEPVVESVSDIPADQGGAVLVEWTASGHDKLNLQTITHYSIWRAVNPVPGVAPQSGDIPLLSDPGEIGPDFAGSATIASGGFFWEWLDNQSAYYLPGYSYIADTPSDSVSNDPGTYYFMVMAHTFNQFVAYPSQPDSGYSVDNLGPSAPMMLTAVRNGSDVDLEWDPSFALDLSEYAVYRRDQSGVTPEPLFFLSDSPDTMYTDVNAPTTALYYIVTSVDIHENESPPTNEAMVDPIVTDVGDRTLPLTQLQVGPNHPNPFNGSTELLVGLPDDTDVTLDVFDVAGRRVYTRDLGRLGAGWQRVSYDGHDTMGRPLPSGVYFYRISAAGNTTTKKMVIRR